MKVTAERLPESQVLLQIELEETEIERHKERAYRTLVQRYSVPGFRRGKAPRSVLERYLGPDALLQEGLEELMDRSALEAVRQESLDPISRPEVTGVQSLAPLSFKVTVPLRPQVELGDYAALRVPWEPVQPTPAEEEEVLEAVRRQTTPWEPVERAVQAGDLLTLDVRGVVEEPGPAAEGTAASADPEARVIMDQKGLSYLLEEETSYPLPGFGHQLVGMGKGETREFTLQVPEDFGARDLAGKGCRFVATVQETKEQRLPAMDDEWAKEVLGGYDSLETLRAKVRADLQERADARAHADYEAKALDALAAQAKLEFPPVLVESEIDHMLQDEDDRLRGVGLSLAAQVASMGRDLSSLREELQVQARQRVERALLVSQLAEAEKVAVPTEEIDAEIARAVSSQPEGEARTAAEQLFANEAARDTVRRRLLAQKAMGRLTAIARGEGKAEPSETSREAATASREGG